MGAIHSRRSSDFNDLSSPSKPLAVPLVRLVQPDIGVDTVWLHPDCTENCTKARSRTNQQVRLRHKKPRPGYGRAAEAAIYAGKRVEVGKVPFAKILAEYRRATASKVHSRSKRASLAMLEQRLGTVRLVDLTVKRLISFVAEREAEG